MSKSLIVLLFAGVAGLVACGGKAADVEDVPAPTFGIGPENGQPMGPHGQPEDPPMIGQHVPRDGAGPAPAPAGNMTSHGGAILTSSAITAIFWGKKWADPTWTSDKIAGLDSFYGGLGGSTYAATNAEYSDANGAVGTNVAYNGYVVDPNATGFRSAPRTSAILAEVCKVVGGSAVANGYYPVYTDLPRGSAGYCAWHSYGACNGVPVQFGFFFALDGDAGCDPRDTSGLHSQGLAALVNVSGHEYSETVTDPRNGGWYDSNGAENSDKCAWSWPVNAPTLLTLANGSQWKLQANWSNAAFTAGAGFANRSGQLGCIFTTP